MQALGVLVVGRTTCQQHTKNNDSKMTTTSTAVYRSHKQLPGTAVLLRTLYNKKLSRSSTSIIVKALCSTAYEDKSNTKAHLEAILQRERTATLVERKDADRCTCPPEEMWDALFRRQGDGRFDGDVLLLWSTYDNVSWSSNGPNIGSRSAFVGPRWVL